MQKMRIDEVLQIIWKEIASAKDNACILPN